MCNAPKEGLLLITLGRVSLYSGFHPLVRNVLLQLFAKSCEGLLGQNVATVSAHQPGEVPKSSSLQPYQRVDENRCIFSAKMRR